jgi:cellulose synthase/poly-beta-1,6-N-acetylglucosamine synthase-like glycosyltransferase
VSFVIPVKNDAARLDWCLRSIVANDYPRDRVRIVVADNGSTDDSAAVARSYGATVLHLPGIRLGELRNRAAAAAPGDILAFVDADHEIVPGWIRAAVEALEDPSVAAAGAACVPPEPGTWVQRLYDRLRRHPARPQPVDWLGSGNMAVKRAAFEDVAGFDVTLETCEDVDLCRKLRARGLGLVADPRMRNTHFGDPQTLSHVFFGEMWRGRDNVRVSLRAPRSWRSLVSAAMPVGVLVSLLAAIGGLITATRAGLIVAAAAASVVLLLIAARAARMVAGARLSELPAAFFVAGAYELGRALAMSGLSLYRRRRKEASA